MTVCFDVLWCESVRVCVCAVCARGCAYNSTMMWKSQLDEALVDDGQVITPCSIPSDYTPSFFPQSTCADLGERQFVEAHPAP